MKTEERKKRGIEGVCLADGGDAAAAERLSRVLQVPLQTAPGEGLCLVFDAGGTALCGGGLTLRGDLTAMCPRLRPNNLNGELLVKAARLKARPEQPTAVDATAGMGEDALLLAAAGFDVTLYEYDPVIAALLRDALRRAADDPTLAPVVGRMTLCEADSIKALSVMETAPDVVLLDPMFPGRTKSGLIKKKFQLLQQLEQPCGDEKALVMAALAARPQKIVIKRPLKGPYLAGVKPAFSLNGKAIRYDCILPASQKTGE